MKKIIKLLDSTINITCDIDLKYIDYFQKCYESGEELNSYNTININVHKTEIPKTINGETIKIHTTKHSYWNFYGEYKIVNGVREVLWPSKKILIKLQKEMIDIGYSSALKDNFVGESVYHIMRSISLYKRNNKNANLLHASGVVYKGYGILFTGMSGAGKTTLLLNMIKNMKANILTNDRIFLKSNDKKVVGYSWPSYASFCEGTLCEYEELKKLAIEYQDNENNKYRTQNWSEPIEYSFTKDKKRSYPMMFLCDAFNTKFKKSNIINYIVLSHLDINNKLDIIKELDYDEDKEKILNIIRSQLFDVIEPSFEPWHGYNLDNNSNSCIQLIDNLRKSNCKIIYCDINPKSIYKLNKFIKKLIK